ncbi:hypothetical protein V6Z12_A11G128900 [Gossypium hirsutum]
MTLIATSISSLACSVFSITLRSISRFDSLPVLDMFLPGDTV